MTMATIPPNSTINCAQYASFNSILADQNANFTSIFTECPTACSVALGEANSDLAGIGALVSYTALAFLNSVFCIPLFACYSFFLRPEGRQSLRRLFKRFFVAETLLIIPILVACAVLATSGPSMFELMVVAALCFFSIAALGCLILIEFKFLTARFLRTRNEQRQQRQSVDYVHLTSRSREQLVPSKKPSRTRLASSCMDIYYFVGGLRHFHSHSPHSDAAQSKRIYLPGLAVGLLISIVTIIEWTVSFNGPLADAWSENCQSAPLFGANVFPIFIVPPGLALIVVFIALYFRMRILRLAFFAFLYTLLIIVLLLHIAFFLDIIFTVVAMMSMPGQRANILEWGFGQVLSVFVWVPTMTDLCLWVVKSVRRREAFWKSWKEIKATPQEIRDESSPNSVPVIMALSQVDMMERGQNRAGKGVGAGSSAGSTATSERPALRRTSTM